MRLTNKSILVTGGAGFVGSHLVEKLIDEKPDNLVVVDNFYLGKKRNLYFAKQKFHDLKIYNQDATKQKEMEKIFKDENVDVVFDLAVIPLPTSLVEPKWSYDTNVKLASTMCELARKDVFKTLIHYSSSEAYGSAVQVPMCEDHPLKPTTPYGASKIASDHLLSSYYMTFGIDVSILRPFNVYGPRQNEGTYAGVIPLTIKRILQGDSPVIHGDGLQTRDYTYVTDLVEATIKTYKVKATRGKPLNIASGKETTIKELISKIAKLMNCKKPIIYDKPRPGDVRRFFGSDSLAKKLINYQPKVDFEEGLKHTIKWYTRRFKNTLTRSS